MAVQLLGGWGSGNVDTRWDKKDVTSDYKNLDSFHFGKLLAAMQKKGLPTYEGTYRWIVSSNVRFTLYADTLVIAHQIEGDGTQQGIRTEIPLDFVSNNYGALTFFAPAVTSGPVSYIYKTVTLSVVNAPT